MADHRVETEPYGDFVRRVVRSYGRRIAAGELEELPRLLELRDTIDTAAAEAVAALVSEHEHAWQTIAGTLGITRQAAMKRWPDAHSSRRPGGQPSRLR